MSGGGLMTMFLVSLEKHETRVVVILISPTWSELAWRCYICRARMVTGGPYKDGIKRGLVVPEMCSSDDRNRMKSIEASLAQRPTPLELKTFQLPVEGTVRSRSGMLTGVSTSANCKSKLCLCFQGLMQMI